MTDVFFPKSLINRIKLSGNGTQVINNLVISAVPSFQ
ncbi:hypothetical protein [Pedobacter steynii]